MIAYLASQLRELGVPVKVEDCTVRTFDDAVDRMVTSQLAIIGISIVVTMSRNAFDPIWKLLE
ncbi:MAG: hypothetical protein WCF90_08280 [Methanomicrobiales archaeon]